MYRALLAVLLLGSAPAPLLPPDPPGDGTALEAATHALCGKSMVLLGEWPTHGNGHTDAFKAALVTRLVTRCGFGAIAWEASFYEFAAIADAQRRRESVSPDQIGDAIGGLWRFDREILPMLPVLADRLNAGRLRMGGLDDQLGGLGEHYSNDVLPDQLTAALPPSRRDACRAALHRRIYWDYPDAASANEAHDELLRCLSLSETTELGGIPPGERAAILDNLRATLAPNVNDQEALFRARDRQMAVNLAWLRDRWRPRTKVIVWCATVHAARPVYTAEGTREPTPSGLRAYVTNFGEQVGRRWPGAFVLGFTAQSGTVRAGRKREQPVLPPLPGSLEALAVPNGQEAFFIGSRALHKLGMAPGAGFTPEVTTVRWRDALDGVVVFRREWPAHSTRPGY